MPVAVVFILRAVVLVLLWGFVIAAIVAVRHDLLGDKPAKATAPAAAASPPAPPSTRARSRRREPVIARQLVVVDGAQSGATVALGRLPVTIGRAADCGLALTDDYASNHHAKLVPNGDGWQLEDTGSTNGTFVADRKVSSPVKVAVGTPIRIGRTVMELPVMTLYLRVGALSHVGIVRDGNEDSLFAGRQLLAVADGVGGSAYGEVASATTISTFAPIDAEPPDSVDDPLAVLREGVRTANDRLREMTERDPKLTGMGTTLTAMLWSQQRLGLVQVGDSRAYRLRDGQLDQISRDQTFVQMLVEEGRITAEQALSHPQRSVILSAIDGREPLEPAVELLDPRAGDRYLLCSDGLSDYVAVADIAAGMTADDPQPTCERLVALALDAGAPDNVSCIVADLIDTEPAADDRLPIIAGALAEVAEAADDSHPTTQLRTAAAVPSSSASAPRQRRGAGRRLGVVVAVVVVLVAIAVVGTIVYSRHQYYVAATGTPPTQQVAIYQGVHGHAPGLGSHVKATTNIPVTALPEDERQQVQGGGINASGSDGAEQVVNNLRRQSCSLATAAATPVVTASASTTPRPTASKRSVIPAPPTPPPWCNP